MNHKLILLAITFLVYTSISFADTRHGGFEPTKISDCKLWLDASDEDTVVLSNENTRIVQWDDKSGNGYHVVQSSQAFQPTYVENILNSKSIIRFNGVSQYFTGDSPDIKANDAKTVFIVAKKQGDTSRGILSTRITRGGAFNLRSFYAEYFHTGVGGIRATIDGSKFNIISFIVNSNGSLPKKIFANGVELMLLVDTLGPAITEATDYFDVGRQSGNYFDDDLAEIIYYKRILTNLEKRQVEKYLSIKWAIILE